MTQLLRLVRDLIWGIVLGIGLCSIVAAVSFVPLDLFGTPDFTLKLGPLAFISFDQAGPGVTVHAGVLWLGLLLGLGIGIGRHLNRRRT